MCVLLHISPAAVQRRPAAPPRCSSLCRSGNTPAAAGTSAGRSAHRTSWWWAWRTSDLWILPCPEHHMVTAGGRDSQDGDSQEGDKGRELQSRHKCGRCSFHGGHSESVLVKSGWLKVTKTMQFTDKTEQSSLTRKDAECYMRRLQSITKINFY